MADKKTKKKPAPKPEPEPVSNPPIKPEPVPAQEPKSSDSGSDFANDVMSVITTDMWKRGFYLKALRHQNSGKGKLMTWQTENITSSELEGQELPEVVFSKFGSGIYRLHLHNMDGQRIFKDKKFEIAVGDINEPRPERTTQPAPVNPPNDFKRGLGTFTKNSQERVAERPDVQDAKAKVEMARAELDLIEIEEKKKSLRGGDQNQSLERIVTSFGQSMKDSITLLTQAMVKPAGDSPQIAALNEKIRDLEKKTETNSILNFMAESNKQNIQIMQDSNKTLVETIKQTKSKGGLDDLKETLEIMGIKRKWDKEDREEREYDFMPRDTPPVEEPFWKGVITGIVDFVKELNKDGMLTQKLANMKEPPVQPQLGKTYTEVEEDAVIKRLVDESVEKHKKSLPPESVAEPGTVAVIPAKESVPDANQVIPAGETSEEFAAKKKAMNAMLGLLSEEMILCPRESDWINFALGKLPDDILIAFRDAVEFPGIFAVLKKYADAALVADIEAKITTDATPEKKKLAWFANGFNVLKAEITEMLKPPAPNTVVSTTVPATGPGIGGTSTVTTPAGTVTVTQ